MTMPIVDPLFIAKALFEIGQAYLGLKQPAKARTYFARVAKDHSDDHRAPKARRYLEFIDRGLRP